MRLGTFLFALGISVMASRPWLIGANNAKEFLMTGDRLTAQEAKDIGLIRHVVPAERLMEDAYARALRLANGPRMAIEGTKLTINRLLRQAVEATLDYGLQKEKECMLMYTDGLIDAVNFEGDLWGKEIIPPT